MYEGVTPTRGSALAPSRGFVRATRGPALAASPGLETASGGSLSDLL